VSPPTAANKGIMRGHLALRQRASPSALPIMREFLKQETSTLALPARASPSALPVMRGCQNNCLYFVYVKITSMDAFVWNKDV